MNAIEGGGFGKECRIVLAEYWPSQIVGRRMGGIFSSLLPPGWGVLMKRAGRLCMGGARRDCKEQELPPRSGGVAPDCKDHIVNLLARCVKA